MTQSSGRAARESLLEDDLETELPSAFSWGPEDEEAGSFGSSTAAAPVAPLYCDEYCSRMETIVEMEPGTFAICERVRGESEYRYICHSRRQQDGRGRGLTAWEGARALSRFGAQIHRPCTCSRYSLLLVVRFPITNATRRRMARWSECWPRSDTRRGAKWASASMAA